MNLFTKIDYYIDYNNNYSLRRALTTMGREFNLASSNKNIGHALAVIDTVLKIHDKLAITYREREDYDETMSYSQKLMSQKIKKFVAYLTHRMKSEFGVSKT